MTSPFFSVVIPTYNRENILPHAIQSVLDQSYSNFEIIIVDNGSTDDTESRVQEFNDPRIRYFWQEGSGSPASPRNHGIRESQGEWICFLDSDDLWYVEKLEKLDQCLKENSKTNIISHDLNVLENGLVEEKIKVGPCQEDMFHALLGTNYLALSGTAIQQSFLETNKLCFNEDDAFKTVEDYDLWIYFAKCGARFYFINEALGQYTRNDSNLSSDAWKHVNQAENVIKSHIEALPESIPQKFLMWNKYTATLDCTRAIIKLKNKEYYLGIQLFFIAVLKNPLHVLKRINIFISRRLKRLMG